MGRPPASPGGVAEAKQRASQVKGKTHQALCNVTDDDEGVHDADELVVVEEVAQGPAVHVLVDDARVLGLRAMPQHLDDPVASLSTAGQREEDTRGLIVRTMSSGWRGDEAD